MSKGNTSAKGTTKAKLGCQAVFSISSDSSDTEDYQTTKLLSLLGAQENVCRTGLVQRVHPLVKKKSVVNQIKRIGLESHYGMHNLCVTQCCQVPANVPLRFPCQSVQEQSWLLVPDRRHVCHLLLTPPPKVPTHRRLLKPPSPFSKSAFIFGSLGQSSHFHWLRESQRTSIVTVMLRQKFSDKFDIRSGERDTKLHCQFRGRGGHLNHS